MIAAFVDTPRPEGRPSLARSDMSPNPTLAFLESISLDRAELKFCERFDEQSRIWNFEKHSHPYFELILFLEGKANIHAGDDSLDISLFDVLIYPPGLLHTEQLELGRRQEIICLWADLDPAPGSITQSNSRRSGAFRQIFESIYAEFTGKRHFAQEIVACHLRTLVWLVASTSRSPSRRAKRRSRAA